MASPTYRVKYFDRTLSSKGKGVQIRTFTDRDLAEKFAAANVCYARPCKVETVAPFDHAAVRARINALAAELAELVALFEDGDRQDPHLRSAIRTQKTAIRKLELALTNGAP